MHDPASTKREMLIRYAALAVTVGVVVIAGRDAQAGQNRGAALLLAIPVCSALAAVVAGHLRRGDRWISNAAATILLVFSLVFGLGPSIYLIVPAALLAAAASSAHRRARRSAGWVAALTARR